MWSWHVFNDLPNVLAAEHRFHPPVIDAAAWGVVSAIGLVATWWLRWPGRSTTAAGPPWILAAMLLVTEVGFCFACPVDLRFRSEDWLWGAVGWFAIALFWHR